MNALKGADQTPQRHQEARADEQIANKAKQGREALPTKEPQTQKEPEFIPRAEQLHWRWTELARQIQAEDPIAYNAAHILHPLPGGRVSGNMAAFAWLQSQSRNGTALNYAHHIARCFSTPESSPHAGIFMAEAIRDRAVLHLGFESSAGKHFFCWEKPVQEKAWAVAAASHMAKLIKEGQLERLGWTEMNRTGECLIHRFGKKASHRKEDGNPCFTPKEESR